MDATALTAKIMPESQTWTPSRQHDPHLLHLLQVALEALAAEDDALAKAFSGGREGAEGFYDPANQGLAYWVFETLLVYTIFKAWIPKAKVYWESASYEDASKKADLVVVRDQKTNWFFEAKWWHSNTKKQLNLLDVDIGKLCRAQAAERYLLTFWWSDHLSRGTEILDVEAYCRQHSAMGLTQVEPIWLSSFRTDWTADGGKSRVQDGTFSMAVLHVTPGTTIST